MDWTHVDPLTEIEGRIGILELDQRAWQHQLDDAHQAKVRALHLVDAAQAAEDDARRHVRDDAQEIDQLREDLRAIIPGQRT